MPLHEGAQQVDFVARVDLCAQLRAEVGLVPSVGEQGCFGQGSVWPCGPHRRGGPKGRRSRHSQQPSSRLCQRVSRGVLESYQQVVHDAAALLGILSRGQQALRRVVHVPRQDMRLVNSVDAAHLCRASKVLDFGSERGRHQRFVQTAGQGVATHRGQLHVCQRPLAGLSPARVGQACQPIGGDKRIPQTAFSPRVFTSQGPHP